MTEVTDILTDPISGDLLDKNGDDVIGDATEQHQNDLLLAQEGWYKQSPTTGVGITEFLLSEDPTEMLRKIRMQFTADGMIINKLKAAPTLQINAEYK
jgi:hypothetical protein